MGPMDLQPVLPISDGNAGLEAAASVASSSMSNGTNSTQKANSGPFNICVHVPIKGQSNIMVNFRELAEKKYGWAAMNPGISQKLHFDQQDGDSSDDSTDTASDTGEGQGENENNQESKRKRRRLHDETYDRTDPFIDDEELYIEEDTAVSKDGFFVYSGPLIMKDSKVSIEKADGSGLRRSRGNRRNFNPRKRILSTKRTPAKKDENNAPETASPRPNPNQNSETKRKESSNAPQASATADGAGGNAATPTVPKRPTKKKNEQSEKKDSEAKKVTKRKADDSDIIWVDQASTVESTGRTDEAAVRPVSTDSATNTLRMQPQSQVNSGLDSMNNAGQLSSQSMSPSAIAGTSNGARTPGPTDRPAAKKRTPKPKLVSQDGSGKNGSSSPANLPEGSGSEQQKPKKEIVRRPIEPPPPGQIPYGLKKDGTPRKIARPRAKASPAGDGPEAPRASPMATQIHLPASPPVNGDSITSRSLEASKHADGVTVAIDNRNQHEADQFMNHQH